MADMRAPGVGLLLAQIGAHATERFAARVAGLDLTTPQVGLLRLVALDPGQSQQTLASTLGTPPSRLVTLVDGLDERGLIQRRRNADDRRLNAVHLTVAGERVMATIGGLATTHDEELVRALDRTERRQLRELLTRIAADQGLTSGVHPGYRTLPAEAVTGRGRRRGPARS